MLSTYSHSKNKQIIFEWMQIKLTQLRKKNTYSLPMKFWKATWAFCEIGFKKNPQNQWLQTCCIIVCHHCHYAKSKILQWKQRGEHSVITACRTRHLSWTTMASCWSSRCSTCNLGVMAAWLATITETLHHFMPLRPECLVEVNGWTLQRAPCVGFKGN